MNKEVLPKWYALYTLILLGWLISVFTTRSIKVKFDKITIGVLIITGYVFCSSFLSAYGMSPAFQYIGFLLIFLLFKLADNWDTKWLYSIIVGICVLQAIYGILQFFHVVDHDYSFAVVGSFDNPAGFAACLAAGFSFCFALLGIRKRLNYIVVSAMLIIGLSIVLSQSRAGMIAIFAVTTIFLYARFSSKLSKKDKRIVLLSVVPVSLAVLLAAVWLFKKNSATGRLLIWETTANMITERPIVGWGNTSFQSQYMLYQADYFKNHPDSSFRPLADNVSHPFNEFLLFIYQYGIVGLTLLCGLIFVIFTKRTKEDFVFQLCILSVLIFACFSYPLRYPFVWLMLAFCLARLSDNSTKIYGQYRDDISLIYRVVMVIVLLPGFYFLTKDFRFEYQWNRIARLSLMGETRALLPQYEKLNKQWNGNPLFLYNYGAELNFIKEYERSIRVLKKCELYWNDYDVQMILADNNLNLGKFNVATKYYELASNMCPNRYEPLYQLHQIYVKIGDKTRAVYIARQIVDMEVKVPSLRVNLIKKEMERYLDDNKSR
ncbi:MAG TPA: O-antigen ligase family protein [Sphingobacterium sp.]|nr:O-antigen ligase family protein [Sphingobacterium sp.]